MSLREQVIRETRRITGALLVVIGVGTGALLYHRSLSGLDLALLAAAHQNAHSVPQEKWIIEHSSSPVTARILSSADPDIPQSWQEETLRSERPHWYTLGEQRVLLLPVEVDSDEGPDDPHHLPEVSDGDEVPALVLAQAHRPSLLESIGSFFLVYSGVASASAVGASWLLRQRLSAAMEPMARASLAISRVVGLEAGTRLEVDGPAEVRHLLGAVNALLERLENASRSQARFTAEAAHELRTPVSALRGELEVCLRRPRSAEEYRLQLESAREEVLRLGELVEGLLAFSRLDSGQASENREWEHTGELLRQAAHQERRELEQAGCSLRIEQRADPEVHVNRALVVAALANLLRNVARYAPKEPVTVTVEETTEGVAFIVADQGPGIPPEEHAAVFDRFMRGGRARRDHPGGLGLGLPLAREVARRHGGECELLPSQRGCTVRFWLPCRPSESAAA